MEEGEYGGTVPLVLYQVDLLDGRGEREADLVGVVVYADADGLVQGVTALLILLIGLLVGGHSLLVGRVGIKDALHLLGHQGNRDAGFDLLAVVVIDHHGVVVVWGDFLLELEALVLEGA